MRTDSIAYGSLALRPEIVDTTAWEVVGGGAQLAGGAQICAPTVYARPRARACATRRTVALGIAGAAVLLVFTVFLFAFQSSRIAWRDSFVNGLETRSVVVEPGESLWDIAGAHAVEGLPVGEEVELIRSWNSLSAAPLQPGTELLVPAISHR